MPLELPPENVIYQSLEDLVTTVNNHAKAEGYAVTKRQTKKAKDEVNRVYLCCDRGRKYQDKITLESRKRQTGTRQMECPFTAIGKHTGNTWDLTVQNGEHNHPPSIHANAHLAHRQATPEVRESVSHRISAGIPTRQIMSTLRLANPELILSRRDVQNTRHTIRNNRLGIFTRIQALMHKLRDFQWIYRHQVDDQDRV